MQKYGEAAVMQMYFEMLPKAAEAIAKPLQSVDSITMYGEGNSSKMVGDITKSLSQVTNGVSEGLGVDIKSVLAGFLGGKIASKPTKETEVVEVTKQIIETSNPIEETKQDIRPNEDKTIGKDSSDEDNN